MNYIVCATGEKIIVDRDIAVKLKDAHVSLNGRGYARFSLRNGTNPVFLARWIMGAGPTNSVFFTNGRLDCRRKSLVLKPYKRGRRKPYKLVNIAQRHYKIRYYVPKIHLDKKIKVYE